MFLYCPIAVFMVDFYIGNLRICISTRTAHDSLKILGFCYLTSFFFFSVHTGLFWQISFGNSNFGKTYFFNIFLLETLQDIWYFDILRKKEFFYISNYHIYWLELSYFYHFCSFQHFYLVTQVKDFDINPL